MSEQLTPRERDAFLRKLGWSGKGPFRERRWSQAPEFMLDGKPVNAEYRSAQPMTLERIHARIDAILAGATSLDQLP